VSERYRFRVVSTCGALYGVQRARKRYRCDGHMASERHWIEAGTLYVASALPPDHNEIGNVGWWHSRFCMECAPAEYADEASAS
jgi:hypothetical protein